MFIKKEENKVLILQLFKYIYKLILINFSDCVYMSKLAHTEKPEGDFFQPLKSSFRRLLKSNITQKFFNITKPYYWLKHSISKLVS